WDKERRVVARIEASASHADDMLRRGIDIRYVVTSLQGSDAEHIYETIYCARGQAENLIKQHKAQLSSDRTSCRSPLANQMRLILHTGAYWLLLDLRAAIPSWNPLRHTEFATVRLRLLKIASRIIEHASRIRIALASCCPEAETFTLVALKLQPSGPLAAGATMPRRAPIHSPPTRRQRHRPNQSAALGARRTDERASQKLAFRSCIRVHKVG